MTFLYLFISSSKVEEVALAEASDGGVCNFNPPQGWLLIAPARHNSNKFDSALAYSQFWIYNSKFWIKHTLPPPTGTPSNIEGEFLFIYYYI